MGKDPNPPLLLVDGTEPRGLSVSVRRNPDTGEGQVVIGGNRLSLIDYVAATRYVMAHPIEVDNDPRTALVDNIASDGKPHANRKDPARPRSTGDTKG